MAKIPLEDNFNDIIGKALRGHKLDVPRAAQQAGVTPAQLQQLLDGQFDEAALRRVAPVLQLGAAQLVASAKKSWYPAEVGPIDGLLCFNTPYEDMTVNSYLVWDPASRRAAAFDTGADCATMLAAVRDQRLQVELILLTHTHGDHILDLTRLKKATGAPAHVGRQEQFTEATPFDPGHAFAVGKLKIETRQTSGHARGGITYLVSGLRKPLAIVGDAIFAGSMGGGMIDYAEALRTNRQSILSLPADTVLCPGHGPLTTVGEQQTHNPFFTAAA